MQLNLIEMNRSAARECYVKIVVVIWLDADAQVCRGRGRRNYSSGHRWYSYRVGPAPAATYGPSGRLAVPCAGFVPVIARLIVEVRARGGHVRRAHLGESPVLC